LANYTTFPLSNYVNVFFYWPIEIATLNETATAS